MGNRTNFLPQNNVVVAPKKLTRIVIVIDRSGSMDFCQREVPIQLKKQFEAIKQNAEGDVFVTLNDFSYNVRNIFLNYTPDQAIDYSYVFRPDGGTALSDGIYDAITRLEKNETVDSNTTNDWGYLVVVMTDGGENSSSTPARTVAQKMHDKQMTGHWTFAFMCPVGYKNSLVNHYGAIQENITEWGATKQEFERVTGQTMSASVNYLQNRAAGQTAVTKFYTDLSNFDPAASKLLDVTRAMKSYKVEKETDITSFYQTKTGLTYNPKDGKAYYQLTKKELIQPQKNILVRDKKTKTIYGGDVRKALKMADGTAGVNLRVEPGNHANYDIFVQSMSPNRKLVRGTELLVVK